MSKETSTVEGRALKWTGENSASEGQVQGPRLCRTDLSGWFRYVHWREQGHHLCQLPWFTGASPLCEKSWREGERDRAREGQVRPRGPVIVVTIF